MLDIIQLKSKWEKEKSFYIKKEVGDGVQKFVKDVLKSPEIFNLKEGANSTPLEKRKNEFKEEEKKKAARHADVVIFINSDIIIPMEVEKYQNIEAGEKQIIQYQLDWNEHSNRRYGILTDGYTWRFYNNNEYREFTLDEIFNQTNLFLEFWQEYIKPEFYYLSFFEKKGQKSLFKEIETLHVEEYRQTFFEDITKLIRSFKNKINIEGYLVSLDKKEREKRAVELTYAYIIQFILYKTLVDNEFSKFKKDFVNRQEAIYEALKSKQYKSVLSIIEAISQAISNNIYRPFSKEQEFISQTLVNLIRQPKNELHEVSPWLDVFVFIKKYNFSNVRNEIFGYIYENYLKELYEDTKKGQYFTDPAVVNFMLQQVGYTPEEITKRLNNDLRDNCVSIIDPSCGSGTFLYSAVDQIIKAVPDGSEEQSKKIEELVNNNVFGLDIAEFPLYLAEMNILMRMLPLIISEKYNNPIDKKIKVFLTKDSIAEFINSGLENTVNDLDVAGQQGQISFFDVVKNIELGYQSYVRDEGDIEEMKQSMKPPRRRFDFVIGNPPYVGYNECSKQKILIFELMKQGKVKLNNIYGMNLHSIPNNRKKYSPKPNLYTFFVALGIALLKDGGKLCYIIPQTMLVNPNFDVIRYHLAKFTTIERIITFSGKMFIGRGLKQKEPVATSSLVFVVSRKLPSLTHQTEIIHYKDPGDEVEVCLRNILNGKKIKKNKISQGKLLQNVINWNFIKQNKDFLDFYEEYKRITDGVSIYYTHLLAEQKFGNRFYFDIGYNIDEKILQHEIISDGYQCPKLNEKFYSIKSVGGYWPNERNKDSNFQIKLLTTNQRYHLLDSKYKIIWSYNNTTRFFFTDMPVIWARNKILGIGSENKNEIMYLFALLNSKITHLLLNDIIKIEQEDTRTILVSLQIVKDQIRIPKINEDNQFIKNEIIKRVGEMLALEDIKISDLVDFSKVMMQKFDKVEVAGGNLILTKDGKEIKCKIKKDGDLVDKTIKEKYLNDKLFKDKEISLSELKDLPVIDFEKQKQLKDYIDDLVFVLYFNVQLEKVGLDEAETIKIKCKKVEFYKVVEK